MSSFKGSKMAAEKVLKIGARLQVIMKDCPVPVLMWYPSY